MILIFSQDKDVSTAKVIAWLINLNIEYLNIPDNESVDILHRIEISNSFTKISFKFKERVYLLSDFSVVWFRRGGLKFSLSSSSLSCKTNLKNEILTHLNNEIKTLVDFIIYYIRDNCIIINDPRNFNANKLISLYEAVKVGLKIPLTEICKEAPINIRKSKKKIITKNIQDILAFHDVDEKYLIKHSTVSPNAIEPNSFFYSLFQLAIPKVYEIRVFIFFEYCYSIAIFSQLRMEAKFDFRDIDNSSNLKMSPYKLPIEIELKLKLLLSKMNLESASIDLIYDGKEYLFLEVNPVGQFDFLSGFGNFYVEKDIALKLSQLSLSTFN